MISTKFTFDESFLVETHARYNRQRNHRNLVVVLGLVTSVFLIIASTYLIYSGDFDMGITPVLFITIAVCAILYERWSTKRGLRSSPFKDMEFEFFFHEESFEAVTTISSSSLQWSLFTRAVHFSDGILLFRGSKEFNWIPYDTLVSGSIEQLRDLLRRKIAKHEEAEQVGDGDAEPAV
ncbi:MAG: YcxB family protein [Akkermansiaceae bacterium]